MKKYFTLFKLSWQNGLVYRVNVLMWRIRQFLSAFVALTIWAVIYENNPTGFGYTKSGMLTYIFLTAILQSLVLSSALGGLAQLIYSGSISKLLIKPVNIFTYLFTQDLADKVKNIFAAAFELIILYLIFKPEFPIPSVAHLAIFIVTSFLGMILLFQIMLLFGSIGFWSPETWGPRFLFFMLIELSSGKLFPLDIFPQIIQKIIYLTPFPYFTFIQSQIFLQRLDTAQLTKSIIYLLLWLVILYFLVQKIWKKGWRDYAAAGQ